VSKVAIIDYGMGNSWSVKSAFEFMNYSVKIIDSPLTLKNYPLAVLPGVGAFNHAIERLDYLGFSNEIREFVNSPNKYILGICLGMHVFGTVGFENTETNGLDLIKGRVNEFDLSSSEPLNLPHVGFNKVSLNSKSELLKGFESEPYFYFDHNFIFENCEAPVKSTTNYGKDFVSLFETNNVFGVQFHPEKSQKFGLKLLNNFGSLG
jgi:glutamine amidotransferase